MTKTHELEHLKKAFLFRDVPEDVLNALAQKVVHRTLAKDEVLFRLGDKGDALYIIDEGWVKIVRQDNQGNEVVLNSCGPGEAIGEMSVLDQEPRSAGVVAISDAIVLELKQEGFITLLEQRPDVALTLIRSISSRLRFSGAYIQKVIEWSKRISEGDYSFIEQQADLTVQNAKDEDKAGQLLAAFFQMVKGVKAREENLKRQVEKLTLQIDEARRKQEFEELTGTDFYANLKSQAAKIRQQRTDKQS
jgi:CRP-like cAMP-binding protein